MTSFMEIRIQTMAAKMIAATSKPRMIPPTQSLMAPLASPNGANQAEILATLKQTSRNFMLTMGHRAGPEPPAGTNALRELALAVKV